MNPFQGLQIAAILLAVLPDLIKAIGETVEAVQASADETRPEAEKVKEAQEAGIAWLDLAAHQLPLSPKAVEVLKTETIPGLAVFLFHVGEPPKEDPK